MTDRCCTGLDRQHTGYRTAERDRLGARDVGRVADRHAAVLQHLARRRLESHYRVVHRRGRALQAGIGEELDKNQCVRTDHVRPCGVRTHPPVPLVNGPVQGEERDGSGARPREQVRRARPRPGRSDVDPVLRAGRLCANEHAVAGHERHAVDHEQAAQRRDVNGRRDVSRLLPSQTRDGVVDVGLVRRVAGRDWRRQPRNLTRHRQLGHAADVAGVADRDQAVAQQLTGCTVEARDRVRRRARGPGRVASGIPRERPRAVRAPEVQAACTDSAWKRH